MILNFWDHCHFVIAESACDVKNNPRPHKQIENFLEGITAYGFFGQIAVNRAAQLTMFVWVMELLLDMARSGIGIRLQMQNRVYSWYYFRQGK